MRGNMIGNDLAKQTRGRRAARLLRRRREEGAGHALGCVIDRGTAPARQPGHDRREEEEQLTHGALGGSKRLAAMAIRACTLAPRRLLVLPKSTYSLSVALS